MRARVLAPLVAAVLGVAGGVTTALLTPGDATPSPPSAQGDPLHLGFTMVDQPTCTGDSILVLGYGNSVAPLSSAIAGIDKTGLHYLRSARSCATQLGPESKPAPTYVVYRGPYPSSQEPCEQRMSGVDGNNPFVTLLKAGNTELVKCPCEIPDQGPVLRLGMGVSQSATLWIRGLQAMFNDDAPQAFPRSQITGRYDAATEARVEVYQERSPGRVTIPGVVDDKTWPLLTGLLCRKYTY